MATGTLYIIAAPSGAGKTSLVRALVKKMTGLKISVSHVTRPKRHGEVEGLNYYFIDDGTFQTMIAQGQFLEYAKVFGYYYGTSCAWVITQLTLGQDVILEIDWQGAVQIRAQFQQAVSIFIIPPSLGILRQRLEERGREAAEVIDERMQTASKEISHYPEFDYLVVNDHFATALQDLIYIIKAQRLQMQPQKIRQAKLLQTLLAV